jgi:hypothetical protein
MKTLLFAVLPIRLRDSPIWRPIIYSGRIQQGLSSYGSVFVPKSFRQVVEKRALLSLDERRLSTSGTGGGWNDQTSQAEIRRIKAAEIGTRPSGSGPQQGGRTRQSALARAQTGISTCDR